MKVKAVQIWLLVGILLMASFLFVPYQAHASGGNVQVEIRVPSVLVVQYAPTASNHQGNMKVGASRDLLMKRAILLERAETPPIREKQQHVGQQPTSGQRVYITIHTL